MVRSGGAGNAGVAMMMQLLLVFLHVMTKQSVSPPAAPPPLPPNHRSAGLFSVCGGTFLFVFTFVHHILLLPAAAGSEVVSGLMTDFIY